MKQKSVIVFVLVLILGGVLISGCTSSPDDTSTNQSVSTPAPTPSAEPVKSAPVKAVSKETTCPVCNQVCEFSSTQNGIDMYYCYDCEVMFGTDNGQKFYSYMKDYTDDGVIDEDEVYLA